MNPSQLEQIARQRTAEVTRSAESGRIHVSRGPRVPIRHRTGRALAAIGLHIGDGSGDV